MKKKPAPAPGGRLLNVLVVDDSAVVRQVLTTLLTSDQGMQVTAASDPLIAIEKMQRLRPDVIVLDLAMPRMDGLTFLRRVMAEDPIPVVICSSVAERGTDAAFRAMAEGAVDIIRKPKVGVRDFLFESAVTLIDVVRAAAQARILRRPSRMRAASHEESHAPLFVRRAAVPGPAGEKILAIGASTGGPEALRDLLDALPANGPATLIVQHMPELFTRAFAERLNASSAMEVKEAKDGDAVTRGCVLVAPGNMHMQLVRRGHHYAVEVKDGPLVSRHRPSVNVLFQSVAQAAGANALGVLMTGMGDDGADGLLEMKQAGAVTVAQDEASCVVFGMPAKAIQRGAAAAVLGLDGIRAAIVEWSES
jgi:two-component system chemotaxis response regulator CheB